MDSPIAMPNQDYSPKATYVGEMICRNCGREPESSWAFFYEDLPLYCFECDEFAIRPVLGLAARRLDNERPSA